ncbi:MAG: endonuclease MutS2 [Clostridia bacterium]|nr:endonuclease MutS2 [Clostridia bacterium]
MNEKTLKILEFNKIRELLADCATTEGAKKKALSIRPLPTLREVNLFLDRTTDAKKLSSVKGAPSFFSVVEVRDSTDRAKKGALLSLRELLNCAAVYRCARSLSDYAGEDGTESSLGEIFLRLKINRHLEDTFSRCIVSEEMIADEASAELADIRRKIRQTNAKIRDILQKYITGGNKYLQENIVTTRGGRYVIPVKSEYRNEVSGLVHDTSSSGSTIFIEPMAVVEANNELRTLEGKEAYEIERIVYALSAEVGMWADDIDENYLNIIELSYFFACAELSFRMDADRPVFSEKRVIELIRARHPLLDKKTVVPVSVSLGGKRQMLVITGPNTGGKTVTLKTIGLFAAMGQSGLHIPAETGSALCLFDRIFADIGDEQSIEQSLSTFSSHMKTIVGVVSNITPDSLVLFDELGAGTDPVEGAALAVAILEEIKSSGALCAATTHYAELKSYAIETDGVENASCEFDVTTLRPTYRLIIGAPGKSNAFAISKRLGLPSRIVDRAGELIDDETRGFEKVIENLERTREQLDREKEEARSIRTALEREKAEFEVELEKRDALSKKETEDNLKKSRKLLDEARATSSFVFGELDKIRKERDAEDLARKLSDAKRDVRRRMREYEDVLDEPKPFDDDDYPPSRPIRKGDSVVHRNLGARGTVTEEPDKNGNTTVLMGRAKTRANVKDLRLIEDGAVKEKKKDAVSTFKKEVAGSFRPECDVRGMTSEEAKFVVDKFLDEATVASVKSVTVIHGKGTGALRAGLWQFFKSDKRVSEFRAGQYGEGDYGVTVVELK